MDSTEFQAISIQTSTDGNDERNLGTLKVENSLLVFTSDVEGRSIKLPFSQIKLEGGGSNGSVIYITSLVDPNCNIHTRDRKLILLLSKTENQELSKQAKLILKSDKKRINIIITELVGATSFLIFLWIKRSIFVSALLFFIPISVDKQFGELTYSLYSESMELVKEKEINQEFKELTDNLITKIDLQGLEPDIHIVKSDDINAFALPGAKIVFNTALLLAADSPEEVLGVLAHEISHATRRHSMRNLIQSMGLKFTFALIFGDATGVTAMADQTLPFFINMKFSRDLETDADRTGIKYLGKAKISADGFAKFFERLKAELVDKVFSNTALSLFSTHPVTDQRIELIHKLSAKKKNDSVKVNFDYLKFKEKLKKTLNK